MEMVHAPTPTVVATEAGVTLSPVPSLAPDQIQPATMLQRMVEREVAPLYSTGFTPLSPKNYVQVSCRDFE